MFKVGDKLEADEYHKELCGIEYVIITNINEVNEVYHWEANPTIEPFLGMKFKSGYFFHEAKKYETL